MSTAKAIRQQIWERLRPVARPDSRFHLDFANVIPDFLGSEQAVARVTSQPFYRDSRYAFVTPDNALAPLRRQLLDDGKTLVVSTYAIRRGFVLLDPSLIAAEHTLFASWLDGLEHFGRSIGLEEIADRGRFDFMVTGASAVSANGVRFGKGHGYFELEWGMFTDIGVANERTPVIALVHDVQVVEENLYPSETDILVDAVATPTRYFNVKRGQRPKGIKWNQLEPEQLTCTPPLQELQRMQGRAPAMATPE